MKFKQYLEKQLNMHPSMEPQDVAKMCYQATFGADHLLKDLENAKSYFNDEFETTVACGEIPLYEEISDDVCRINLAPWKASGIPGEWLFKIFAASASVSQGTREQQEIYLKSAGELVKAGYTGFGEILWNEYIEMYAGKGMPAVHHSDKYREKEQPAYRIANKRFVRLIPILKRAAKSMLSKDTCVIAIDGRAASGKTTMASQLSYILDCDIIEMDDFFLPLELRTADRFATPGGNVHYERFIEEVLPKVAGAKSFSYRRFDCSKMDFGDMKKIGDGPFRIVEGSYSCHPLFENYADIKIFSDVDSKNQMERILKRNGEAMAERFKNEWIPLEEKYFNAYHIREVADELI